MHYNVFREFLFRYQKKCRLPMNSFWIAYTDASMDEHFRDPNLNIEAVCNIGFMSVSSLQRAFNKYLRVSPKQYLIRLRMNHALNLLTMNELSVKEIAFACGFTDEKYFSRAFKKRYGYPPTQLQNNMII